nr:putative integrase [uncultured bacterium]
MLLYGLYRRLACVAHGAKGLQSRNLQQSAGFIKGVFKIPREEGRFISAPIASCFTNTPEEAKAKKGHRNEQKGGTDAADCSRPRH